MTTADLLRQAQSHHQAGRLAEAQSLYRQILAADPDHAGALHLLGLLAHQNGHHAPAEALMAKAAALAPRNAAFQSGLGHVQRALGRPAAAEAAYRAAVRLQPKDADYHHYLALSLREQGRDAEAERSFREAVRGREAPAAARLDFANLLIETKRGAEAEAVLRPALRAAPAHPQLLNVLGLALVAQGRQGEALACFEQALNAAPEYINAALNRANCLMALERAEEAAAAFALLRSRAPDDPMAARAHARVLLGLGRGEAAEEPLQVLLRADARDAVALHDLARAKAMQDRADLAVTLLEQVTALSPDNADAWFELGMAYRDIGRWDLAVAPHAAAARLGPDNADYRSCYAYALLANGDYAAGWPEFAWRTRKPGNVKLREPEWDGAATAQTVIVHAEQGAGDTIQFCRFLPLAAARARIVVACPPGLTRLLRGLPGIAELADSPPTPAYDLHCPLMSLPLKLGIAPGSFADTVPYLHADPAALQAWAARLAHLPGRRVGLAWAGNPKYPMDRKRSLRFAALAPLLGLPGISFVSLQMGEARPEGGPAGMFDAAPLIGDFADTAALIAALDLVISVDTSVAHLAGALGAPVWLLNRADTDWRWLTGRDDSPWYPSLRIFRQSTPGDWPSVIAAVVEALS